LPRARKRAAGIITTERGLGVCRWQARRVCIGSCRMAAFWFLGGETDETYPFLQLSFII